MTTDEYDSTSHKDSNMYWFPKLDDAISRILRVPLHDGEKAGKPVIVSQEETDALIARDMNQLSMEEREQLYHDVHGIIDVTSEEPEFVELKLKQLEEQLSLIDEKEAYIIAESMSANFVHDIKLRMKFLRADRFNVESAANRMVLYFDKKMELFGKEKLVKEITLDDMDEDDMYVINRGCLQILTQTDRSGRSIFFNELTQQDFARPVNQLRAVFYIISLALENEETQKKGLVAVIYAVGDPSKGKFDGAMTFEMSKIRNALPMRMNCVHFCYSDLRLRFFVNFARVVFEKNTRSRCRTHEGSHMICQYGLMSFGIPIKVLPVTMDGELTREKHIKMMESHRAASPSLQQPVEEAGNMDDMAVLVDEEAVCTPTEYDVLFGRGKMILDHAGNRYFHHLIETKRARYEASQIWEKTVIASEIVSIIKDRNGRFLKRDDESWVEVDVKIARDKVSHAFRSRRNNGSGLSSQRSNGSS